MLSFTDINVLGNLIDATFGKQSSHAGVMAIRAHLAGETLVVTYQDIVNIAKDQDKMRQVEPVLDLAVKSVKMYAARIEKEFAAAAGHKIKLKMKNESSDLEALSYNFLSPIRPTRLRYTVTYEIA